jgi:thiol-disulfide isomerase/thioredoxin
MLGRGVFGDYLFDPHIECVHASSPSLENRGPSYPPGHPQSEVPLAPALPPSTLNLAPKVFRESTMRKRLIPLAAALCWAQYSSALAQDPAQNAPQPAPKSASPGVASPQSQQQANVDTTDQPMSLADMARMARAKKQTDSKPSTKSAKLLDDDNMPRGVYPPDTATASSAAPGSQPPGAPASGSPFSEFRGKVVLLDFWASWCGPCRSALPSLKRLQAVYGSDDFVVISISEDDDEATWRAFVASHQMNWPQRLDSHSGLQHQYGVNALPTYVLIGRDGSVFQKFVGEDAAESIVERIGPDLKSGLSAKP